MGRIRSAKSLRRQRLELSRHHSGSTGFVSQAGLEAWNVSFRDVHRQLL